MGLLKGEVLCNVSWVDLGRALCHRSNPWFLPFFFRSTNKREGKLGAQRASVGIYSIFFLVGGGFWADLCRDSYYLSNPNTPNICIPQAQDTESAMHHDSQLDAHKDGIYWEHPGVISRSTSK